MLLTDYLEKLTQMKAGLDAMRPIRKDALRELNEKLRLEWTFHSNKLEGNSLDFNETKLLINRGLTAKGKPIKDHRDIEGHQTVVEGLEALVRRDDLISLAELRELHKLLLKEPYLADATTPDGEPTKRRIEIGQYKTAPNHVVTRTGKTFHYTEPGHVEAEMIELWDWLKSEDDTLKANSADATHPVVVATELHYRFVRIHPFDDGNGRLSRILMNYMLLRHGYFPAVIPIDAREPYFDALGVADETDDLTDLTQLIADSVESSMGWALKAAHGESLKEPDDWKKRLKINEKLIDGIEGEEVKVVRSPEAIIKAAVSFQPLIIKLLEVAHAFNKFYTDPRHRLHITLFKTTTIDVAKPASIPVKLDVKSIQKELNEQVFETQQVYDQLDFDQQQRISAVGNLYKSTDGLPGDLHIYLKTDYGTLKKAGVEGLGCNYTCGLVFEKYKYKIVVPDINIRDRQGTKEVFSKLYDSKITPQEIDSISGQFGDTLNQHLEGLIRRKNE